MEEVKEHRAVEPPMLSVLSGGGEDVRLVTEAADSVWTAPVTPLEFLPLIYSVVSCSPYGEQRFTKSLPSITRTKCCPRSPAGSGLRHL